ncbi:MAG: flagellar biosynthetic protein FliR [Planctomycetota bacterium]
MNWATQSLLAYVPCFMLHVMRAGALVYFLPGLGQGADTRWLRLILGLCLGAIFWWLGTRTMVLTGGLPQLIGLAVVELLIGAAIGYVVQLVSAILAVAGEIIAQEMGFTMAQVLDPLSGASTQVVSQFLQLFAMLMVFALDLHHDFLRALARAFTAIPVGHGFDPALLFRRTSTLVAFALEAGVRYAMPVLAVMLVVTATLSVLSRAVPNINLMEFSFGIRILLAMAMALLLLTEGMAPLIESFRTVIGGANRLFTGM